MNNNRQNNDSITTYGYRFNYLSRYFIFKEKVNFMEGVGIFFIIIGVIIINYFKRKKK